MSVGILACSGFVPKNRIKTAEIAKAHNVDESIAKQLGVSEKSFAGIEDDTLTLAYKSSFDAINNLKTAVSDFIPENIEAVFVGSETHTYAVKPTSSMLASFLGMDNQYFSADLQFACKAGTTAIQTVYNMVKAGSIQYGLAVGADVAKGAPMDMLEYTAASGSASFILGIENSEAAIAIIKETISYNSDTPDFWRSEGEIYPMHAGRFSGSSYSKTIKAAVKLLCDKTGLSVPDFDHIVLHMPNGKLPKVVASELGATESQLAAGFIVPEIGNTYAACSLLGLVSVLEKANPGEKILVCSYGSGAGSDAFYIETTDKIKQFNRSNSLELQMQNKIYKTYAEYKINEMNKYD